MKKINHYKILLGLCGALIIFAITGCYKKLDQVPQSDLTEASYWKSANDLKLAANYFYAWLPSITDCGIDRSSIDAYSANGPSSISDGSRVTSGSDGYWTDNYRVIRACNNFLEKSVDISGDEAEVKKYQAEVRFFRAWSYYQLVIRFGDVPLILQTFGLEDEALLNSPRSPRDEVINAIYADLDWAAANLPQPNAIAVADYGRISATAALALKARMALFEGTRQKFHNYGNASEHLQVAKNTAAAIMDGGKHQLFTYAAAPDSSYHYNFQFVGEGPTNKENILVHLYGQDKSNNISGHNYSRNLEQGSVLIPTRALCDAYLYKDGLPYTKSIYDSTTPSKQKRTLSEFSNRDLRMGQTIFNKNSFYLTGYYVPTFSFTSTGYKCSKYFNAQDWNDNPGYIDYQIIRYAEILLIYAEATYELNEAISDADLAKSINLTRSRAGIPALTNAFVLANGLNMREEIRRERRVELALEGFRYWDLLRWKTAEIELPQAIKGIRYIPAEYTNQTKLPSNAVLDADSVVVAQPASQRTFDPLRDYLYPIPTQQIALEPALTQNPGWE
ncbi:MAG: RagB/SusD family nutrient uptake outer membrane protein [Agriterribacter sp.]